MKKTAKVGTALVVAVIAVGSIVTYVKAESPFSFIASNKITNIELMKGQTVYADPGAEFIVRTGKTIAVSKDKEGIPDVTDGADLAPGAQISDNHLLIFPKDTRGVAADPNTDNEIWINIRGTFRVYDESGNEVTPISE